MISVIKEWFYLYHTDFFHKFHAISVKFVKNCRKCDIKCCISCNLRTFLPNRKYRKYRVIIVSKPKISCNIVWTLKKDIVKGWLGPYFTKSWVPISKFMWQCYLLSIPTSQRRMSKLFVGGSVDLCAF